MRFSKFIDGLIKAVTNDSVHVYRGKSGSYWKKGPQKSGRKGESILFKWLKK